MTIEKLTDEFSNSTTVEQGLVCAHKLIDAQAAEIERLRVECQEWNDELDVRVKEGCAAAETRCAELEDQLQDADADTCSDPYECWKAEKRALSAAEARLAEATARIESAVFWLDAEGADDDTARVRALDALNFLASAQPSVSARTEAEDCPSCNRRRLKP